MIAAFLSEEVQPVAERELKRLSSQVANDGIQAITTQAAKLSNATNDELFNQRNLNQLAKLTTADLKEQLKRSDLGSELLTHLGDKAEPVFDEFARRYESVSNRFAMQFRSKSRFWATIIAMIMAVGLNIDSVFILDSYLKNHTARDVIIGQMDQILEKYDTDVQEAIASLNSEPNPFAEFGLESDEETNPADDFKLAYDKTRNTFESLMGFGLPIGWDYFPYSERHTLFGEESSTEASTEISSGAETTALTASDSLDDDPSGVFADRRSISSLGDLGKWIFGVCLTGLLAGVGAPFWYDLVTGISRVRERHKTAQSSSP